MDEQSKYDPKQRERAKQTARDEDDRAIAAGEKSPEQANREAAAFVFPIAVHDLEKSRLS